MDPVRGLGRQDAHTHPLMYNREQIYRFYLKHTR